MRAREMSLAAVMGALSCAVALYVSRGQMAGGPDAVSYLSLAESLSEGDGFRNWLESPMSTFPVGWPVAIWLLTLIGLGVQWAAFVWIAVSLIAIPLLSCVILRRCCDVVVVRILAVACVALSPVLLPWGFLALTEVPFTALLLGCCAAALVSLDEGRQRWIWVAVACGSLLPTMRYAGISVPVALAAWIWWATPEPGVETNKSSRRSMTASLALVAGLTPIGALVVRNLIVTDHAFGGRPPSLLSPLQVSLQAIAALGRAPLWAVESAPTVIAVASGLAVITALGWAAFRRGRSEPSGGRAARVLLVALTGAQVIALILARSTAEIDDLDSRLMAPACALCVLVGVSIIGDLARSERSVLQRVAVGALAVWLVIGAGLTARTVVKGNPDGYTGERWEAVHASRALAALPEECRRTTVDDVVEGRSVDCGVMANDPWGWYLSDIRPVLSPRERSNVDGRTDLEVLRRLTDKGASVYLLWTTVIEPYGFLLTPQELAERGQGKLNVEAVAEDDGITLYRLTAETSP